MPATLSSLSVSQVNKKMNDACRSGNLNELKEIISFLKDKKEKLSSNSLNNLVQITCHYGNVETLQFLLTSPELPEADINYEHGKNLMVASFHGDVKIVEYLLLSPELKNHVNPNLRAGEALMQACRCNHLEIVKLFFSDERLKKHTILRDVTCNDDIAIDLAIEEKSTDVLNYLILEHDIGIPEKFQSKIHRYNMDDTLNKIFEEKRKRKEIIDLKEKMQQELSLKQEIKIKIKI